MCHTGANGGEEGPKRGSKGPQVDRISVGAIVGHGRSIEGKALVLNSCKPLFFDIFTILAKISNLLERDYTYLETFP